MEDEAWGIDFEGEVAVVTGDVPMGASVAEAAAMLSWQPHTVRGAISGALKKRLGLTIAAERIDGRGTVYRIATEG